jgi:hypothetical protein
MLAQMANDQGDGFDPLEAIQPRRSTFVERRTIAVVGGLMIMVAAGVLVLALGKGAVPISAADELSAMAKHRPADHRPNAQAEEHR